MPRKRKTDETPSRSAKDPRDLAALEVFRRLQAGDEGAVATFKEMMDHPTAGPKVVEFFGNLAARTQEFAVDMVAQTNLAIKAATPRKMAKLRAELEGPAPSPIERLLVERVVFCWLILWEYESALTLRAGQLTLEQSKYHHRRIDAAHRRYMSSLRTLATVRKLGVPAVQVNVGTHHHAGAESPAPCTCGDESMLPTFADGEARSRLSSMGVP